MLLLVLVLGVAAPAQAARPVEKAREASSRAPRYSLDEILDAIRTVESGGQREGGVHATGDGGRAIGPYQVHRAHWTDARLPGRFEDCRDAQYARREVLAYWKRWCPAALESSDAEVLARVHNGGPDGARERCTLAYWGRVKGVLERRAAERRAVRQEPSPAR